MSQSQDDIDGKAALDKLRAAAADGLHDAAKRVLAAANRHVPTEHGDLEKSGIASVDDDALRAAVSYGRGLSAAYAVREHEDMTLRHDDGRTAKWLEVAMNSEGKAMLEQLAATIRAQMGT